VTEREWLRSTDPQPMLTFLRGRGIFSERKARLFVVACCRRISSLLTDDMSRNAVEVAEQYAEGLADDAALKVAQEAAQAAYSAVRVTPDALAYCAAFPPVEAARVNYRRRFNICILAADVASMAPAAGASQADGVPLYDEAVQGIERAAQADLLRDLVANPFRHLRPFTLTVLAWNDGCIAKLATAIYEQKRFEDLPVLADALEEAGCEECDIVAHCRQHGAAHVRGCWVIDRLLGKE
jgi:hypothetical protein